MEQNIIIYVGIGKALTIIWSVLVAVVVGAWYASHRLTKVETKVEGFSNRLTGLEGRLDKAYESMSPIALTKKGNDILIDSGLKKYIDDNKLIFTEHCKNFSAMTSAYDVQLATFQLFSVFDFPQDLELKFKEEAYKAGISMGVLRRIGGIYFRDLCLSDLKLDPKELDNSQPLAEA